MLYKLISDIIRRFSMATSASSERRSIVLVHGAAGGVGIAAIEISKIKGATVIATVGSEDKRKIAEGHGADFTINYNDGGFRTSSSTH